MFGDIHVAAFLQNETHHCKFFFWLGVMFTSDPISGSNSVIVVNANFGLGESVVSGSSDPDTIRVNRDPDDLHNPVKLQLGSTRVGLKKTCIVEAGEGIGNVMMEM